MEPRHDGQPVVRAEVGGAADSRPAQLLLSVDGLSVEFQTSLGNLKALDSVSLGIDRGQTLGIVGESGSGKSVLLRSIMGLYRPGVARRQGSVRYLGRELVGLRRRNLRKLWGPELSIIFQDPMTSLNPVVRVGRQIAESVSADSNDKTAVEEQAYQLLRLVGIPEARRRLRQYPHELSGGMRQRVAIAIALAARPRLLLADEPTTALDVTVQAQILNLLSELRTQMEMAMILVSHDLGVVATRTDRIIVMYAGQIVEEAATNELFDNTRMPYTEALIRCIPKLDGEPHSRLHTIGGRPPLLIGPTTGCRFADRCPYTQPKCRELEPPLVTDDSNHAYRCWFPLGHTMAGSAPVDHAAPVAINGGR